MKKRNIALVMAGLMAAMSLTGCSGGAQEEASADGAAKTEAAGSEAADGGEKSLTVAWWGNQVQELHWTDSFLNGVITGINWQLHLQEIPFRM